MFGPLQRQRPGQLHHCGLGGGGRGQLGAYPQARDRCDVDQAAVLAGAQQLTRRGLRNWHTPD